MKITEPQAIRARILYYASQPKPDKFYDPAEIAYDENGNEIKPNGISSRVPGATIGEIERIIKVIHKDDAVEYRRILFGWLFGAENLPPVSMSSKALTPQMWYGLKKWIGVKPVQNNGKTTWTHREAFEEELWWITAHAKCIYDMCNRYKPPITLGQGNEWIQSDQIKNNIQGWLDYEKSGIVSAGIQSGAGIVRPIPWEEPAKPVLDPEPVKSMPYNAPGRATGGLIEQICTVVSSVDESEL